MLHMKQPAMALNSPDVPGPHYRMWETYTIPWGAIAPTVVTLIENSVHNSVASGVLLRNVIINCHGSPGVLAVGGSGSRITQADVPAFTALRRLPGFGGWATLWLVACKAARGSAGKAFCSALARASGCRVVAAEDNQHVEKGAHLPLAAIRMQDFYRNRGFSWLPAVGAIDEYEGLVWQFEPTAGIMAHAYPHLLESVH